MKYRRFLPDLIFLLVVILLLVLGLLLFLLSHISVAASGRGVPGAMGSLAVLAIPQPDPFTGPVTGAINVLYRNAVEWLNRQGSLLTFTDPAATYNSQAVRQLWGVVLFLADSLIGIFIVLSGYQISFAGFSSRYAEALEALPTLIFAAIGANASLIFAQFWIDLNNLLCAVLLTQMDGHALGAFQIVLAAGLSVLLLPLAAFLALLLIFLGIQMSVRLGVIIFLTVWLSVLFALLTNRYTQRYGQAGLTAYPTTVLTQALQVSVLVLGQKTLMPFLTGSIGPSSALAPVAAVLAGIALVWLTLRIPSMLRSWALQPVAESSQALRFLLIGSFARIIRL